MAYGNTKKDGSGTYYHNLLDSEGRLIITQQSILELETEATANDSDKSWTVPAGEYWKILSLLAVLVTTAVAGTRQLCIEITDGTNVIFRIIPGGTQAASLTRNYNFAVGMTHLSAFIDTTHITSPLPSELVLLPGYVIRVYDKAAVDAAADDLSLYMMVSKFIP